MSFKKIKFGEFVTLQRGYDLTKEQIVDGVYPVVSSTSIMGYHNMYKAQAPGVVIGRSGTLGEAQYIEENYWPHNTSLYVKDFKGNNPKFVYYFLKDFGTERSGGGSAVPTLNRNNLYIIDIKVPDVETQGKIVELLSPLDNLIENNQKQIKLLEEAAHRLYKEWFVDLRFPGHEDVTIADGVPEGWTSKRISDLGEIITGKTPSTSNSAYYGGNIPFVKIPDMHGVIYPIITESTLTTEGANTQKGKFLPKNSIMVSCIATVGLVNIAVEPCQTNQQINSIILHNEKDLYYTYFCVKRLKTLLDGVGSNGATMTNVNKTKFGNIEVLYPTEELCLQFYGFCEPIFKKILCVSKQAMKLRKMRDMLLPKLMTGEIEV